MKVPVVPTEPASTAEKKVTRAETVLRKESPERVAEVPVPVSIVVKKVTRVVNVLKRKSLVMEVGTTKPASTAEKMDIRVETALKNANLEKVVLEEAVETVPASTVEKKVT